MTKRCYTRSYGIGAGRRIDDVDDFHVEEDWSVIQNLGLWVSTRIMPRRHQQQLRPAQPVWHEKSDHRDGSEQGVCFLNIVPMVMQEGKRSCP